MSATIVILGAGGRLGAALVRAWRAVLPAGVTLRALPRTALDLAQPLALEAFLRELEGTRWVINCAGLTSLEACEANPQLAWQVNADAVGTLARSCAQVGTRLLHFSTDYVFDGTWHRSYREDDIPSPLSVYGASKFAGEEQVLAADAPHLVARVSWVFGPDRPAFPDFMLQRALAGESLAAVSDKWSSPTYTLDVADWLAPFVLQDRSIPGGIYHLCNSGVCTWRDYAQATMDLAHELHLLPIAREVAPLPMSAMTSWTGQRPVYTPLATEKISAQLGYSPRPWLEALRDFLQTKKSPAPGSPALVA